MLRSKSPEVAHRCRLSCERARPNIPQHLPPLMTLEDARFCPERTSSLCTTFGGAGK
jgi:hypothetical protein